MIDLKAISPKAGKKFSPNLYVWLRHQQLPTLRAFSINEREGYDDSRRIVLGRLMDGGTYVFGATLGNILASGTYATHGNYGADAWQMKPLPGLFQGYAKWGHCYIDPQHKMNFTDPRWTVTGDHRACLWCGFEQRKIVVRRYVDDDRWVTA